MIMIERFMRIFHKGFIVVLSSLLVLVLSGFVNATDWSAASPMTVARMSHTATLLPDGRVLVVAGNMGSPNAELYDPVTDSWSSAGFLTTSRIGRYSHSATLLSDGRVLIAGGDGSSGFLSSTELYSPVTDFWSAASSLSAARLAHSATLLPDGRVLIAGGGW